MSKLSPNRQPALLTLGIPSMQPIISEPVMLLPPRLKTWLDLQWIGHALWIATLMLIGLGVHYYSRISFIQYISAITALGILWLNVHFYVLRRRKEEDGLSIWVDLDEIQLLKKNTVMYKDSLQNLRVMQMEPSFKSTRASEILLIEGKFFPKIFISAGPSINIRHALGKVDYCVASEKEWRHLCQVLATCQGPA